jgi:hypothetical protein
MKLLQVTHDAARGVPKTPRVLVLPVSVAFVAIRSHGRYRQVPFFHCGLKTEGTMDRPVGHRPTESAAFKAKSQGCAVGGTCRYPVHSNRNPYSPGALGLEAAVTAIIE